MMTTEDGEPGFVAILLDYPAGWEPAVAARGRGRYEAGISSR